MKKFTAITDGGKYGVQAATTIKIREGMTASFSPSPRYLRTQGLELLPDGEEFEARIVKQFFVGEWVDVRPNFPESFLPDQQREVLAPLVKDQDVASVQNREVNVVATLGSGSGNSDEQVRRVLKRILDAWGDCHEEFAIPEEELKDCVWCGGFLYIEQGGETVDCPVCKGTGVERPETVINAEKFAEQIEDIMFHSDSEFMDLLQGPNSEQEKLIEEYQNARAIMGEFKDKYVASVHQDSIVPCVAPVDTCNTDERDEILRVLNLAQAELRAMYKRLGITYSNVLVQIDNLFTELERSKNVNKSPSNPEPVEQEGSRAYEVYCKEYSQIVHATSLIQAVKIFESVSGRRDVIFAEDVEYAKEERRTAELQSLKQSDAVEFAEWASRYYTHVNGNLWDGDNDESYSTAELYKLFTLK